MAPDNLSISSELISAMSALNTEVTYAGPKKIDGELVFISDAEPLAQHSMEHIRAAMSICEQGITRDISGIKSKLCTMLDSDDFEKIDNMLRKIEKKL